MSISEYVSQFNENDIIRVFSEIVKAEAPSMCFANREPDIVDVEVFLDKYCIAVGEEGIADIIVQEWKDRLNKYFGCVTDRAAKDLATTALSECFLSSGYTLYKSYSPYASAFDWIDDNYKLVEVSLDEYDISYVNMVLLFDFKDCEIDVDKYIGADWNILSHTMNRIMNIVKTKI